MLKICLAGAAGKMGSTVLREAATKGHQIVGAVEASGNACIGKSLRELGISDSDIRIVNSENISEAAGNAILEQWGAYVTRVAPQSVEAIAEAEANKMAKAYSNKKV